MWQQQKIPSSEVAVVFRLKQNNKFRKRKLGMGNISREEGAMHLCFLLTTVKANLEDLLQWTISRIWKEADRFIKICKCRHPQMLFVFIPWKKQMFCYTLKKLKVTQRGIKISVMGTIAGILCFHFLLYFLLDFWAFHLFQ